MDLYDNLLPAADPPARRLSAPSSPPTPPQRRAAQAYAAPCVNGSSASPSPTPRSDHHHHRHGEFPHLCCHGSSPPVHVYGNSPPVHAFGKDPVVPERRGNPSRHHGSAPAAPRTVQRGGSAPPCGGCVNPIIPEAERNGVCPWACVTPPPHYHAGHRHTPPTSPPPLHHQCGTHHLLQNKEHKKAKKESFFAFLSLKCEITRCSADLVLREDLYSAYADFCRFLNKKPISVVFMGRLLSPMGIKASARVGGVQGIGQKYAYVGLAWARGPPEDEESEPRGRRRYSRPRTASPAFQPCGSKGLVQCDHTYYRNRSKLHPADDDAATPDDSSLTPFDHCYCVELHQADSAVSRSKPSDMHEQDAEQGRPSSDDEKCGILPAVGSGPSGNYRYARLQNFQRFLEEHLVLTLTSDVSVLSSDLFDHYYEYCLNRDLATARKEVINKCLTSLGVRTKSVRVADAEALECAYTGLAWSANLRGEKFRNIVEKMPSPLESTAEVEAGDDSLQQQVDAREVSPTDFWTRVHYMAVIKAHEDSGLLDTSWNDESPAPAL